MKKRLIALFLALALMAGTALSAAAVSGDLDTSLETLEDQSAVANAGDYDETADAGRVSTLSAAGVARLNGLVQAFYDTVEDAGYTPMVYGNLYSYRNMFTPTLFDEENPMWLAQYNTQTPYTGRFDFWQYTSSGAVDGISGNVDCNFAFGNAYVSRSAGIQLTTGATTYTSPYTGRTYTIPQTSTIHNGIDVSAWQGIIDWKAVAADGVEFAIIRVAYRGNSTGKLVQDRYALANIEGALENGIQVGVYVYSQAISPEEAEEEANIAINLVRGLGISLPIVYDLEFAEGDGGYTGRLWNYYNGAEAVSELTIQPVNYPAGNRIVTNCDLTGTVTSNSSIKSFTGSIYRADGTLVMSASEPITGTVTQINISPSAVNAGLPFRSLTSGYYYLQYTAEDNIGATATWTSPIFAVAPTTLFTDMGNSTQWYYNAVYQLASKGVIAGYTADNGSLYFAPDSNISRAEIAVLLYRLNGSPSVAGLANPFLDSTANWYQNALKWAYSKGIVSGRDTVTFDPDASVTRQELSKMISRYADGRASATTMSSYTDAADVANWAVEAMSWCVSQGIISGTSDTELSPLGTATRAQAATMLSRLLALES